MISHSDRTIVATKTRQPSELRASVGATSAKPRLLFLLTVIAILAAAQSLKSLWLTWSERPEQAWIGVPVPLLAGTAIGGLILFGVRQALLRRVGITFNRSVSQRRPGVTPSVTTCAPTPSTSPEQVEEANLPKIVKSLVLYCARNGLRRRFGILTGRLRSLGRWLSRRLNRPRYKGEANHLNRMARPGRPIVTITQGVLELLERDVEAFLTERGQDKEAGGTFAGELEFDESGALRAIHITTYIEAGPGANATATSFEADEVHAKGCLRWLQLGGVTTRLVGMVHRHPGRFVHPSRGDLLADQETARASHQDLVFGIVTLGNPDEEPASLRIGRLRIDIFLLGPATNFAYDRILPIVRAQAATPIPKAGVRLATSRGASLTFDINTLKALAGITRVTLAAIEGERGPSVVVQISDGDRNATYFIIAESDGSLRLLIQRPCASLREVPGPWNDASIGRHIWFSHLVCEARRTLDGEREPFELSGVRRAPTWWERDPRRLLMERQAMEDIYGHRARIYRKNDLLYWSLTLRQSGRSWDIFIIYPKKYPFSPPDIESAVPLPASPHSIAGSLNPCWRSPWKSDWLPNRDTASVVAAAALRWYASYLVFATLGHWPEEADH